MSWLQLTDKYLLLMKGGSNQYIDRARIGDGQLIESFPRRWFTSRQQRPKTIIVNMDQSGDDIPSFAESQKLQLLKKFEVPISLQLYEDLKKQTSILSILELFKSRIGDFTDEFYTYHDTLSNKSLKVQPFTITASEEVKQITSLNFPIYDFDSRDPDYTRTSPSFGSFFLEVLEQSKITVRLYIAEYLPSDLNIAVRIELLMKPDRNRRRKVVSLAALEKSVMPLITPIEAGRLDDVLLQLKRDRGITINAHGLGGETDIPNLDGLLTLTDIMDSLAGHYSAFWDWVGDGIVISRTLTVA